MIRVSSLVLVAASALGLVAQNPPHANQDVDRALSRVVFFDWAKSDGSSSKLVRSEVFVEYGAPSWKPEFEAAAGRIPAGTRVRLGKDTWTILETWNDLDFGGVTLPAGSYGVALKKGDGDAWSLVAFERTALFAQRLEANWPAEARGGIELPLTVTRSETVAATMELHLVPAADVDESHAVTLALAFGPLRAQAEFKVLGL